MEADLRMSFRQINRGDVCHRDTRTIASAGAGPIGRRVRGDPVRCRPCKVFQPQLSVNWYHV